AALVEVAFEEMLPAAPLHIRLRAVLPREEAARQREIADRAEVFLPDDGSERLLEVATVAEAVGGLNDLIAGQALCLRHGERLPQAVRLVVRGTDGPDLARLDQSRESAKRLLQRHVLIVDVGEINVDMIRPEATERVLDRRLDIGSR